MQNNMRNQFEETPEPDKQKKIIKTTFLVCSLLIIAFSVADIVRVSPTLISYIKTKSTASLTNYGNSLNNTNNCRILSIVNGVKIYKGCDIDYSQFNTKSNVGASLKAKLMALSSARQQELNYQLKQTQIAISTNGLDWQVGWNEKIILTDAQKKQLTGLLGKPPVLKSGSKSVKSDPTLPDFYDWRSVGGKNYITSVKDQGNCGSCWAFGADATFEGHIQAYYNNPNLIPNLAEQDLVSCAIPYSSDGVGGCSGAYDYQIETIFKTYWVNTGNAVESSFPYSTTDTPCSAKLINWQKTAWKDLSYKRIDLTDNLADNINKIKKALITNGPVDVGMYVYPDFFSYKSGIYQHDINGFAASGAHSVTIVGFGKNDGRDYWIVKNSWGTAWGENGYFRIYADDSNISSWYAFVVDGPKSPTSQSVICTDNDMDKFCYWGIGPKPAIGCPNSCKDQIIEDCDDSSKILNNDNCGISSNKIGILSIISNISGADVYIKDLAIGNYIYRGQTPLTTSLNIGGRTIKVSKTGYSDVILNVNIQEGSTANLNVSLVHDPNILDGWPIESDSLTKIAVADLNNDGKQEIIYSYYDSSNYVSLNILNYTGKQFSASWPKLIGWPVKSILVSDINNDGKKEIIVIESTNPAGPYSRVHVFASDGTELNGWPQIIDPITGDAPQMASIGDINNDGYNEIIVGTGMSTGNVGTKIYAFNYKGKILSGWPVSVPNNYLPRSEPVLSDINNDGYKEIICGLIKIDLTGGAVEAFDYKGNKIFLHNNELWNWSLASADINNDGKYEIFDHGYALNGDGSNLSGWTNQRYTYNGTEYDSVISRFAIGDINKDGYPEIAYSDWLGNLQLVDRIGKPLPNFPIPAEPGLLDGDPLIANIDNGIGEDIVVNSSQTNNIYAYDLNGSPISGFPKKIDSPSNGTMILSDVNGDGKTELIATSSKFIYIFGLYAFYDSSLMDWPMLQHDSQHTGCYDCRSPVTVTSPNGGETFSSNQSIPITWKSAGVSSKISIEITKNDSPFIMISLLADNIGSYNYPSIPSSMVGGNNFKIKITDADNKSVYDSSDNYFSVAECGILRIGSSLTPGQSVMSCNGTYRLTLQKDGNAVLYNVSNKVLWASNTTNTAGKTSAKLTMQSDGNLVIYDSLDSTIRKALWATMKFGTPAGGLYVQPDGNLVIYDTAGKVIWSSNTAVHQ
ncbi:MAG: FG-GAP-like repeat-containing protein [Candidatus Staskawiczbacteria bacterium]|nr:FG-GAP-like repeat-containing protein [Candidatus Staskawiczbacteria bacterium]